VSDSQWNAIKGVSIVRADKYKIRDLVMTDTRTAEYDDMFDKHTPLHQLDSHTAVRLVQMKGIWPTAPREFLLCSSWVENEDGSLLIFSRSPTDETQKQSKGYVRGFIAVSGYHVQPYESYAKAGKEAQRPAALQPDQCLVTLCAHTELGGSLPSSVINSLSTGAPIKVLTGISAVMEWERKK
jgi:hypothetical protein